MISEKIGIDLPQYPSCSTCIYMEHDAPMNAHERPDSLCKYNAPTIDNHGYSVWPIVTPGHWCGCWRVNIEKVKTGIESMRPSVLQLLQSGKR